MGDITIPIYKLSSGEKVQMWMRLVAILAKFKKPVVQNQNLIRITRISIRGSIRYYCHGCGLHDATSFDYCPHCHEKEYND